MKIKQVISNTYYTYAQYRYNICHEIDATKVAKLMQTIPMQNLTLCIIPKPYQYTSEIIICNSLKKNATLKNISLDYIESNRNNGVRYKSFISSLAIALKDNTSITTISLYCNNKKHLQDTSPLTELLETNKKIKEINLFFTRCNEKNLSEIFKALKNNTSLTNIRIETYSDAKKRNSSKNYVLFVGINKRPVTVTTKKGLLFVCKALKGINHITRLDLSNVILTKKDEDDLLCFYKNSFIATKVILDEKHKVLENKINAFAGRYDTLTTLAQGMFTVKKENILSCLNYEALDTSLDTKNGKKTVKYTSSFFEISKFIVGEPFECVDDKKMNKEVTLSSAGKNILQAQNAVLNIYKNK